MRVSLIHPFTPKAVGISEENVATFHSQPHIHALNEYHSNNNDTEIFIDYFTNDWFGYSNKHLNLKYRFFPVNKDIRGDFRKWKKQFSRACLKAYIKNPPDISIINMSGYLSPFTRDLGKRIKNLGKQYIAMVGGIHYNYNNENIEYYQNANHILVHTNLQREEMQASSLFRDMDIRVFPLGVDCIKFKPTTKTEDSSPKLLFVGRIVELKRIHLCIEALNLLTINGFENAKLEIIGPIYSIDYMNTLKELISRFNLDSNVIYHGHKSYEELPKYYNDADLLCLPSKNESFGMVMVEAMACGTPVAAINTIGGPKEVIKNGYNGILCSTEQYPQEVLNFFRNKAKMEQMKIEARKTIINSYSSEVTYKVLSNSISNCIR